MEKLQWSFISFATASIVHLLLRLIIGRELRASGLGLYTLVFTFYSFGLQFAAFGIGTALSKYIAQHSENLDKVRDFAASGILGSGASGLVLGLLLYSLSEPIALNFFHSLEMVYLLKITAISFPFIAVQKSVTGTLNGLLRMKYFAFINILQNVLVFLASIVFVLYLEMGVEGAVYGFVFPTILVGLVSPAYIRGLLTNYPKKSRNTLKQLSWFGFYVVLANSVGLINTQIDRILIGYYMNETEVGYYAVAVIFMQGLTLVPLAVQRITAPAITRHYTRNEYGDIKKLIKTYMGKIFAITLLFSVGIALAGKLLISFLFTEEFLPAYTPMLILLAGYSIYAAYVSIGATLSSIGKVNIISRIGACCALANTGLNLALIPKFGLLGAAGATSVSLLVTVLFNMYFIRKYLQEGET